MAEGDDPEFDEAIDSLAQIFIDEAESEYHSQLEPFDVYAQKVRHEFHQTMSDFRKRFSHGYQVLMSKVKDQHGTGNLKRAGGGPWIRA